LSIERFVVLDDRDVESLNPAVFRERCVQVNPYTGLRFCDYVEAMKILGCESELQQETLATRSVSIDNLQALLTPVALRDEADADETLAVARSDERGVHKNNDDHDDDADDDDDEIRWKDV
jgi:hypothetical protein